MAESLFETVWLWLTANFSDFQLATFGSFLIHEGVFFLSGLPYMILDLWDPAFLRKYKIQKRRTNGLRAQSRAVVKLVLYHVGVNLPLMLVSYPAFQAMGFTSALPLPSWRLVSLQLIFFFVMEDFVFYWGHRALHTKFLYRHIHSVHHEFSTPFGITAEYAHPVEILFLGVATVIGPAITGCHLSVLWLWMSVRLMETVDVHCGYDFPWAVNKFFPLYCGADFHDFHHRLVYTKSGNYASTFTWMDRLFGTDQLYFTLKANQAKGVAIDAKDAIKDDAKTS